MAAGIRDFEPGGLRGVEFGADGPRPDRESAVGLTGQRQRLLPRRA